MKPIKLILLAATVAVGLAMVSLASAHPLPWGYDGTVLFDLNPDTERDVVPDKPRVSGGEDVSPGGLQPEFVDPEPVAEPTNVQGDDSCLWCRATLPERDNLNFCPFCGMDLKLVPCAGCGEELEPDWRFCIACGTEV